jgi:hypothetical protein
MSPPTVTFFPLIFTTSSDASMPFG